jgi:hypothetical protein
MRAKHIAPASPRQQAPVGAFGGQWSFLGRSAVPPLCDKAVLDLATRVDAALHSRAVGSAARATLASWSRGGRSGDHSSGGGGNCRRRSKHARVGERSGSRSMNACSSLPTPALPHVTRALAVLEAAKHAKAVWASPQMPWKFPLPRIKTPALVQAMTANCASGWTHHC